MRSIFRQCFLGAGCLAAAVLFTGCEEELSQEDVNQQRREAQTALEKAREETRDAQAEADRQIAMIERERREAIADLQARLSDPDVDPAEVRDEIAAVEREADRKISDIRRRAASDLKGVHEDAREKLREAHRATDRYEAQQARNRYVQDTEQTLARLDSDIDRLNDRVDVAREPEGFDRLMEIVEERQQQAHDALESLKSAELEEWETFRDEVELAIEQLKSSYDAAAENLRTR